MKLAGSVLLLIALWPLSSQAQTADAPSQQTAASPQAAAAAPHHPAGDFVTVRGYKLWYESEGSGEPVVLISGGPGFSHSYFHPYFSALARSYRVIYFDSLGRGKSDKAKNPAEYTFDRDVEDVEGLRKALGLDKINVLGHSYGGMVAQSYALRFPGAVHKLILIDTLVSGEMWQANNDNSNYEIRNQFPEIWEKISEVRAKGLLTCSKEYQDIVSAPPNLLYFYNPSVIDQNPQDDGPINLDVYCGIAGNDADFKIGGSIAKLDFRPQLKNLRMPILILAGRYDRVSFPRYAVEFKKYAPQSQFVMFEKSGHFPFIEMPDETFKTITEFLAK